MYQFFPKSIKDIIHKLISQSPTNYVKYKNTVLPAKHLRFCGSEFNNDKFFFSSALVEANRLINRFELNINSQLLDVGCGVGRLPIGILNRLGDIKKYNGIDVSARAIEWCQRFINRWHPNFQFKHIDMENPRYNPQGKKVKNNFSLPFKNREFDIIYLYSVFSHMKMDDIQLYLKEFSRLLEPSGKIFLTAFIEENVPDMEINPPHYRMTWSGPLHCVRYNKEFFKSILKNHNFTIDSFEYGNETNGQSAFYLSYK
ncbi:MAG: class I SAM-dependent methyltransferase [Promethearchaeota archaeon]